MKKMLCIGLVIAFAVIILTACGNNKNNTYDDLFAVVNKTNADGKILVNKETNVMYWMSYGPYNRGCLTLLVNSDGSPMVYGLKHY